MDKDRRILLIIREMEKGVEYAKLSSSYNTLMYNYATVVDQSTERAQLIEEQYNTAIKHEGISPELHIKYHHVCEKLETSLRNFHSSYKTFLNAYAIVLRYYLPTQLQKELKATSRLHKFLSLYEKYLKSIDTSKKKKTLVRLFSKLKNSYEYTNFRSTSIEHPQLKGKKNFNVLISDGNVSGFAYIEQNRKEGDPESSLKQSLPPKNNKKPHINLTVQEVEDCSDVYVHTRPCIFKEGDTINAGTPILEGYESWEEHYAEFGIHTHFFPDKKENPYSLNIGKIEFKSTNIEEMKESADTLLMSTLGRIKNLKNF